MQPTSGGKRGWLYRVVQGRKQGDTAGGNYLCAEVGKSLVTGTAKGRGKG